ncbi:MAG: dihydroneopterin aldolase [Rhizobiales bacterium]|nr:dihydroneopterin aldolase [Hyphomicrobiales bacterium]NRB14068.1 dihydroneopterin aldolase [Hyphomicrobiales bacterium]
MITNLADQQQNLRHIFVHGLKLKASIGVYDHEKTRQQMVIISVDLAVAETTPHHDDIENVVCYKTIVNQIEAYIAAGHVQLVETMAEQIADICLKNPQVKRVLVKIEKPEAFAHATSVGVIIERLQV